MEDALKETLAAGSQRAALIEREGLTLVQVGRFLADTMRKGNKVYVIGEGSCARVAAHVADELLTCSDEGRFLPVIGLRWDANMLASVAADDAVVDHVYSRQVHAFARPGDALLALCFSGRSPAVVEALRACKAIGGVTIALVGGFATLPEGLCDHEVHYRTKNAAAALECHLAVGHLLRRVVETEMRVSVSSESLRATGGGEPELSFSEPAGKAGAFSPGVAQAFPAAKSLAELAPSPTSESGGALGSVAGRNPPVRKRAAKTKTVATGLRDGMIKFRCLHCAEIMTVESKFAGRRGQCPHCLNPFVVPKQGEGIPVPAPAEVAAPAGALAAAAAPTASAPNPVSSGAMHAVSGDNRPERRVFARFSVADAILRYQRDGFPDEDADLEPHTVNDVSRSGVGFIRSADDDGSLDVQAGERIFIRFEFPAFKDPILTEAKVERVVRMDGPIARYKVGCRYLRFVGDGEEKVRRLSENVCLRGIRRG